MYNVLFNAYKAGFEEGQHPNIGETLEGSFKAWLKDVAHP
jgi:hypothetical protein